MAFGEAQVSVPSTWGLVSEGESACLQTLGVVILGNGAMCPPGIQNVGSPSAVTVSLKTISPPSTVDDGPPLKVNGISVYAPGVASVYVIPALESELTLTGDVPRQVLGSLTYSPRAVALSSRARSLVPRTWQYLQFEGLHFAVPPNWVVRHVTNSSLGCDDSRTRKNQVILAAGTSSAASCAPRLATLQSIQAAPGIELDSFGGGFSSSYCPDPHRTSGLTICVDPELSGSTLQASVSTSHGPVSITLGLPGNGTVARTVLDSFTASK